MTRAEIIGQINQKTRKEIIEQISLAKHSKSERLKKFQKERKDLLKGKPNAEDIKQINKQIDDVIEGKDIVIQAENSIIQRLNKQLTQLDKVEQQQTPTPQKTVSAPELTTSNKKNQVVSDNPVLKKSASTPNLGGTVNPTNVGQSNPSQNNSNKPKPSKREKFVNGAKKKLSKAKSFLTPKKKSDENVAVAPNTPTKNTSAVSESIESKLERNLQHKPQSHLSQSQKQDIDKLIANNRRVSFGEVAKFGIKPPSAPIQTVATPSKKNGMLKAFLKPINSTNKKKKTSVSQQPPKNQIRKKHGIRR